MTPPADFAAMETSLYPDPLFHCEPPDGQKHLSEIARCVQFRRLMAMLAPSVLVHANANAGKRNPMQARREGIMGGVFDYACLWGADGSAYLEMKGYDARGRAGKLSTNQIEFGNRLHRMGRNVACFFDPMAAVAWVRSCGAPVRQHT